MDYRFLLLLILFSACGSRDKQKVKLDYDTDHFLAIESDMFFIERVEIFNAHGKTLYELRLDSDGIGLSKVFLFQTHKYYTEQGSMEMVKKDTLKQHIQVEIHSRDKSKIEMFESPFRVDEKGAKILEPILQPFP